MSLSSAEKNLRESSNRYTSKVEEVQASERELKEHRFRFSMVPSTKELQQQEQAIEKQLDRRLRKLRRYELERFTAQQEVDERQREVAEEQRREQSQPLRDLAEKVRAAVLELAREEAERELQLRKSEWSRVLYSHGPQVYQHFIDTIELLGEYAQLTGRAVEFAARGVPGLWRHRDVKQLIQWARAEATESGSGATNTRAAAISAPGGSEAAQSEDTEFEEPIRIEAAGDAAHVDDGASAPITVDSR